MNQQKCVEIRIHPTFLSFLFVSLFIFSNSKALLLCLEFQFSSACKAPIEVTVSTSPQVIKPALNIQTARQFKNFIENPSFSTVARTSISRSQVTVNMAFHQQVQTPAPSTPNAAPNVQNPAAGPQQLGQLLHPRVAALIPEPSSLPAPAPQHQHQHQHRQPHNHHQRHGNHSQYQDDTRFSWALYIELYGLSDVWKTEFDSETDRYGPRTRKIAGNRPGRLTVDDKSGRCQYLYNQVPYMDCRDQTFKQILVSKTLQDTRYYLGHCGGEFVFRYCPSRQSGPNAFLGCTGVTTRDSFRFCGQVPRPRSEYSARFSVVTSKVIRAFAGVLGYFRTHDHGRLPCFLRRACELGSKLPLDDLESLGNKWNIAFPNGTRIPSKIRVAMRLNPVIGEFAHLFQMLADGSPNMETDLEPLIRMVEGSSRLVLGAIAKKHFARLETAAFKQLFSGEYSHNLLVFQDDNVMVSHLSPMWCGQGRTGYTLFRESRDPKLTFCIRTSTHFTSSQDTAPIPCTPLATTNSSSPTSSQLLRRSDSPIGTTLPTTTTTQRHCTRSAGTLHNSSSNIYSPT